MNGAAFLLIPLVAVGWLVIDRKLKSMSTQMLSKNDRKDSRRTSSLLTFVAEWTAMFPIEVGRKLFFPLMWGLRLPLFGSSLLPVRGWSVPWGQGRLLLPGGLFLAPGSSGMEKNGHAIFLDARGSVLSPNGEFQVDPALGRTLFHQLNALKEAEAGATLSVDLVLSAEARRRFSDADAPRVLEELIQRAGLKSDLLPRTEFHLTSAEQVVERVGLLAPQRHIQVVTDEAGVAFWNRLQVPMALLVARLVSGLMKIEVDVVFTGAEADALLSLGNHSGISREKDGSVRLKAIGTPLQRLDQETRQVTLFNVQA
jgi:hypothetical protein